MSLFLDNDVLVKLASWNLLEDGIKACGFESTDVRYLPTTQFWLGLAGKKKCRYSPEVQERLRRVLSAGQPCTQATPEDDGVLPMVHDIDAGEAILLAQAARSANSLLATGDKRCIRALAAAPTCSAFVQLLTGRILCLEQVLLRTIDRLGFAEAKQRVVGSNQLALDTAVRAAFGSGLQADVGNACGSLEHRVKMLAVEAAGVLAAQEYRHFSDGPES